MDDTISGILEKTGAQIRMRRVQLGLTQAEASARAGVAYRTWRRMEKDCSASIEDLVRAAIALRCEHDILALFPKLPASSMDELLKMQQLDAKNAQKRKQRVVRT